MGLKTGLLLLVLLTALVGANGAPRAEPPALPYARYEKKLPSEYIGEAEKGAVTQPTRIPQPPTGPDIPADAYYNYAVDLQNTGHLREAAEAYTQAIAKLKTFSDAYLNRGICYIDLGESEKALADIDFYIRRKPDAPDGYTNRASILVGQKKYSDALATYETALQKSPKPFMLWNLYEGRARVYWAMRDYGKAADDWGRCTTLTSGDTASQIMGQGVEANRALAYLRAGQQATDDATYRQQVGYAVSACTQLLKRATTDSVRAETYLIRAEAYLSRRDTIPAREDADRFIALRPTDADGYLLRAAIYQAAGRVSEAEADRKRAAELKP